MSPIEEQKKPHQLDPILFAHRGGCANAPENTLEAFSHSVALGVTGLESDVWLSADGIPVLSHDNKVGSFGRRITISKSLRSEIPEEILSLEDLYVNFGNEIHFSFDDPVKYIEAFGRNMPGDRPSMLLDHMARRPSEIDAINGMLSLIHI